MAVPLLPLLMAAPGVISGVSNLFGRRRRQREEDKASRGISQLTDVFKQGLQGNFFDTPEAQRAITQILQNQDNQRRQINNTSAVSGATDEAKLSMFGRMNENTANAMGGMAGSGQLWRDRQLQQYQGSLGQLFGVGQANRQNFNQSLQNILGPLQEGINAGVSAGAFDGMNLFGGGKGTANTGGIRAGDKPYQKKNTISSTLYG